MPLGVDLLLCIERRSSMFSQKSLRSDTTRRRWPHRISSLPTTVRFWMFLMTWQWWPSQVDREQNSHHDKYSSRVTGDPSSPQLLIITDGHHADVIPHVGRKWDVQFELRCTTRRSQTSDTQNKANTDKEEKRWRTLQRWCIISPSSKVFISPDAMKVMEMMGGSAQVHGHLAVINDFSPEWDYVDGGSKVLVTGTEFNRGYQYSCVFGDVEVRDFDRNWWGSWLIVDRYRRHWYKMECWDVWYLPGWVEILRFRIMKRSL